MLNRTRSPIALLVLVLALVVQAHADDVIIGKVVRVADGDTITVLENRTQHKIRLFGIDAPERRQDFSNKAKQFVSELVFGKQVRVASMTLTPVIDSHRHEIVFQSMQPPVFSRCESGSALKLIGTRIKII